MDFDRDKFRNLMHHVIYRAGNRDGFGLTKLFKVLWFFEARRFSLYGERFSGARYTRDEHGPRPAQAYPVLDDLVARGAISLRREPYFNRTMRRARALRPPEPGLLNESQAKELEHWIAYVGGVSAKEISDESHDYGWEIAPQGAELPLYALMAERVRDPEGDELEWAKRRAKELNLP